MIALTDEIAELIEEQLQLRLDDAGTHGRACVRELLRFLDHNRSTSMPGYGLCSKCTHYENASDKEPCLSCRTMVLITINWTPDNG